MTVNHPIDETLSAGAKWIGPKHYKEMHRVNIRSFATTPHSAIRHAPNGKGEMLFSRMWGDDDFATRWSFVDHVILPPGASIGVHTHGDNEEMYVILSGTGTMTVDGEVQTVKSGDMILNKVGGAHGLENTSTADMTLLVMEVAL